MILLSEFVAELKARIERDANSLVGGSATSFEDYRHRVGILKGYAESIKVLEEMVKTTAKEERGI